MRTCIPWLDVGWTANTTGGFCHDTTWKHTWSIIGWNQRTDRETSSLTRTIDSVMSIGLVCQSVLGDDRGKIANISNCDRDRSTSSFLPVDVVTLAPHIIGACAKGSATVGIHYPVSNFIFRSCCYFDTWAVFNARRMINSWKMYEFTVFVLTNHRNGLWNNRWICASCHCLSVGCHHCVLASVYVLSDRGRKSSL